MNKKWYLFVFSILILLVSTNGLTEQKNTFLEYSDVRQLTFKFEGLIIETLVSNGELVTKNQSLAKLDNKLIKLEIKKAKAELASTNATYKEVQQEHERALELFDRDILSQVDMDKSHNLLDKNEALYNIKGEKLNILEAKLTYYQLTAPYDGIVLFNQFHNGRLIKNTIQPHITIKLATQNKIQFVINKSNLNAEKTINVKVKNKNYKAHLLGFTFKEAKFHYLYQIQKPNAYLLVGNKVKVIGK